MKGYSNTLNMANKPRKILIVRLSAIGDVVHVLPALRSLRSGFPDSEITWVVEDRAQGIITDHPDLDEVIVFQRKKWQHGIRKISRIYNTLVEVISFYKKLNRTHYDLVIDFQGNLKSGIMTLIAKSEVKIGFGNGHCKEFNYLFTKQQINPPGKRIHKIEKNLALLRGLNIDTKYQSPGFPVSKTDEEYVSDFIYKNIKETAPIIIIHPCTSKFGSFKQWPILNYAVVADKILETYNANVVFTWGPGELEVVNEIILNMKHKALAACEATSIKQLIELIRRADLFIGGDTGPLHIASIFGIPTVAIFGPKDPAIYGPYNDKAIVVRKDLPCSPCSKRTCPKPECMTTILPEEVFHAIEELMRKQVLSAPDKACEVQLVAKPT